MSSTPVDWQRFLRLLGLWTVVSSIVGASAITLETGGLFSKFAATDLVPRVVALSVIRTLAPQAATLSVALSLVMYGHHHGLAADRYRALLVPFIAGVPLVTLLAVPVMLLTSIVIFATYFGVAPKSFWASATSVIELRDCVRGFLIAGVYAAVLGLTASFALPELVGRLKSLVAKLCLTALVLLVLLRILELLAGRV